MELTLGRWTSNATATLGRLKIDGVFECYVCEDAFHEPKIKGKTRIPAGRYEIRLKPFGSSRFDVSYKQKFPQIHKGMLELVGVPGFVGVLIHIGNTHKDTEGCLLVGKSISVGAQLTVSSSKDAYVALYPKIVAALSKGKVFITITDNDRVKK